ncbi:antigen peptide transporter 2 [Echeneis naucrates]|uniref:Antigen peptide transporter 2-like n=1 Tax=Echeneis naucrates TaxID=173247 RepID=A0A665VSF1_ECHNA|nr:antigen peptide transporter 2-like [Echeneis naucrates]XP_029384381.1 antigen peptide transporter 2-like [Echeneis naucrates]XP_029384382.1 antigen peptide transporter 2-like [Echeneis naucrates]
MTKAATCGFVILLFDVLLNVAGRAGLVLLECPTRGQLAVMWTYGAAKWAVLHSFTSMLTDGKHRAVLHRLVALLCLICPVFESGRFLLKNPLEAYTGPSPNLSMLLLGPMSASLACVVWEKGLCGNQKTRKDAVKLDTKQLLLRVVKYFRPDTLHLIAAFSFLILGVICDTYIPLYQGMVIDMLRGEVLEVSFGNAVGQLALFSLGSAMFSGLRGGIFMCTLARLNKRLKHLLFHTLMQQEVHFFEENKPGPLSSRLHSDVDKMGRTVALNANALVRSTVKTVLMLRVMLGLSWELTVLTCIEMPLLAIIQNKYISLSKDLKEQMQDCQAQNKDQASQTIGGIRTVRSFKAEEDEMRRYNEALDQMCAVKRRSGIYRVTFCFLRRLVTLGIKIFMLLRARSLISSGRLSLGSLISFLLYQKPMTNNLKEILYSYGETMSTVGVISKVFSYLDRTPKCKREGELAPEELEGRIVFRNVTFAYPSAPPDKVALKSVSMELQPGKMTALVGPSGGGKTSCVSLMKRLYEPQEGQIVLDGEPLHHYKHKYLHQKLAVVSQNPVLFSGSLRYNIEYGLKDCSIEKVKEAAKKANADNFISGLENEYDTDVGECGGKLSDGQKQCIAIIRALIRDPQVIILDEATSKLDVDAQHAVLQEVLSCGRTILVVAHQLKTVEMADHIIFIEHGRVVEEGTHQELMAKRGRYYCLKEALFSQHS